MCLSVINFSQFIKGCSEDLLKAIRVYASSSLLILIACGLGHIQLFQVDVAHRSNLILVLDKHAVGEWAGRVLDVLVGPLCSLPLVEVHLEERLVMSLLSVHLVLEVDEELLEVVDGVAADN